MRLRHSVWLLTLFDSPIQLVNAVIQNPVFTYARRPWKAKRRWPTPKRPTA